MYLDAVLCSLLGSDDDDPVRGTRAVNGRSRSILQHGEGLDVVGIDGGQGIGSARCGIIRHRNPVNHNERIVAGVERSTATDADTAPGSGLSVGRRYMQPRHLALYQLLWRGDGSFIQFLGLESNDRAAQVVLFDRAIADDHYFVQLFGIVTQGDVHHGLGWQFLCLIADERDDQRSIGIGHQLEVAVQVGDGSGGCSFNQDIRPDDGFALGILHGPVDRYLLGKRMQRKEHPKKEQLQTNSFHVSKSF